MTAKDDTQAGGGSAREGVNAVEQGREKADGMPSASPFFTVKAVAGSQHEIEVLVPYGGPYGQGVDSDGEYFADGTDFSVPGLPDLPRPVVEFHAAHDPVPEVIGTAVDFRDEPGVGRWYRVVLDRTSEKARGLLGALKEGALRASSQAVASFVRKVRDAIGQRITHWPIVELTLIDTRKMGQRPANPLAVVRPIAAKAALAGVGLAWPGGDDPEADGQGRQPGETFSPHPQPSPLKGEGARRAGGGRDTNGKTPPYGHEYMTSMGESNMEDNKLAQAIAREVAAAMASDAEREAAKSRRLPGGVPTVARFGELWKYDNLSASDQAVLVGVLNGVDGKSHMPYRRASDSAVKALAVKLAEDRTRVGAVAQNAMKAAGVPVKANEIQQQDLTGFGDEWVGVAYSQALWEAIRGGTFVAERLPGVEVPPGHESIVIPLEGADPTFYKVAEATGAEASGWPDASIGSSQVGTARQTLNLVKMGARVLWSGELEEDSLIPWVNQLRNQLAQAGAEQLEHAIIDGDTETGATANINDIGGTPAATDLFLLFDGFRKLALVTNADNSRDGGALAAQDFLETVKLMGSAGTNALDQSRVEFILDANTAWKALELSEVKTRDVFTQATIEQGVLTGIWGYKVNRSAFMHYMSADRKADTDGMVDQDTPANNTTGSILAVRWDQWLLGYRRRMTMETTRIARADTTEIVALARLGLIPRDNEAVAITYNLTV